MPLYVTLARGPRADQAEPVLATSDRHVVGAVLQVLARLDEWETDGNDLAATRVPPDEDGNGPLVD